LCLLAAALIWGHPDADLQNRQNGTYAQASGDGAADDVDGLADIPAYTGSPYIELHQNTPLFTEEDAAADSFETYADLDALGRCGTAYACIGTDLMPTGERGAIGQVKPSGWHTVKYNDVIDGNYLYNRCHLIAYELSGENANEKNLITGTRYMNVQGMLPFENQVASYVKKTQNHVLYRVTPIFEGDNLVASGVTMEAYSVEDSGEGICFYVYVYNVQPGIVIDYATGESRREGD
jgi:DNA-entry nuclease